MGNSIIFQVPAHPNLGDKFSRWMGRWRQGGIENYTSDETDGRSARWRSGDPFKDLTLADEKEFLPGGDSWIVYPGKDGPLDSIRFETMRDGITDYELLCLLAERDPQQAQELAQRHILDLDKYDCDVTKFRASRHELLEQLSRPPK